MELSAIASLIALLGFLGFLIERIVQHFVTPIVDHFDIQSSTRTLILMFTSLFLGLVSAFAFGLDVITPLVQPFITDNSVMPLPITGTLFTGIILGGGSQFIHDLWPTNTATVTASIPVGRDEGMSGNGNEGGGQVVASGSVSATGAGRVGGVGTGNGN